MAIRQRQKMKQLQQLTPQQIMLMRLLQLPVTSLEQAIQEAVENNPLLEMEERVDPPVNEEAPVRDEEAPLDSDDDDDEVYRERQEGSMGVRGFERVVADVDTLSDRLFEQLRAESLSERQRTIGQELIGSLDASGYLSRSLELVSNDLAFRQGIDAAPSDIEEVLHVVQSFDPPGIAARNLQECLSLQLHREETPDDVRQLAMCLIDDHFDDFVNRRYDRIKNRLSIDDDLLQQAADLIRHLDPKPGLSESSDRQALYIIPDFIVTVEGGTPRLSLNSGHLPVLRLSDDYMAMLRGLQEQQHIGRSEQQTLQFLKGKSEEAQGFIDTLRTRDTTMLRIMSVIVAAQKAFFISGDKADLRPLLQKDVAEKSGYDISTVSRMVNSKYVQTDFGTLSLKECFTTAVATDDGNEVAAEKIRQTLRDIVAHEDRKAPLTDDELAQALSHRGLKVARRTVAKYREQLGIPIGRLRKTLSLVVFVLLMVTDYYGWAQGPMSYYDSLIYRQTHTPIKSAPAPASVRTDPVKCVLDSILGDGDELIDRIYTESLPSPLWYGNDFSGQRVRLRSFNADSLPDEVNIRLVKSDSGFCFPVRNIITSSYGWRWNRPHRGVDVRLRTGEPVRCAFDGVVRIARPMGAYGNLVVVRHYNGLETVYGHLSKIQVKAMQEVRAGDVLGLGGSTGRSTGPHLHFEVRFQYEPFDPEWILDFENYSLRTHKLHLDKSYFGIRKPRNGEALIYKADKSYVKEQPERKVKKERYYTTVDGDYSELVAFRYGLTLQQLRDLNPGLKKVSPGMRLRVR